MITVALTAPCFRYHVAVLSSLQLFLRQHRLIRPGQRVGIAVSGGADSVALLRALATLAPSLGIVPVVLHFNHKLRGPASDDDAHFVATLTGQLADQLAGQLALPAVIEAGDVAQLAADRHLSIEAAGRAARYAFFLRAAVDHRLDSVATAHTLDDQAETVLLRLLRGTGTSGLAAIHRSCSLAAVAAQFADQPAAQVTSSAASPTPASTPAPGAALRENAAPRLIRPMLSITRQQVEAYLESLGQPFRQDASNLSPQYLRNRIRTLLLPSLERDYNPQLRQALGETAEIAADENAYFEETVSSVLHPALQLGDGVEVKSVELKLIQTQPVALQRRILRRLCQPHGLALDFAQLEALRHFILAARAGSLGLPRGFSAEILRPKLGTPFVRLRPPKSV